MIRAGSALLFRRSSERIKSVLGPDIDAVICDCRCGIAFFAKIIYRQYLPVITAGLHHRYLSGLADEEYLAVGCNRRSEVPRFVSRIQNPCDTLWAADKFAGISRELTTPIHPAAPLRDPLSSCTGRRDRGHVV